MKTEQYQCRAAGTEHWINVPESWVQNLRTQGFEVRELVVRPTSEQIADKLLADSLAVIDAARTRRRTRAEQDEKAFLAGHVDRRARPAVGDTITCVPHAPYYITGVACSICHGSGWAPSSLKTGMKTRCVCGVVG